MIDKTKIIISVISFAVGFGIGFLVRNFINNLVLLVAGFFIGLGVALYLKEKKDKAKR